VEELEDLVPETDRDYLKEKGFTFKATRVGADVHVVIQDFLLPVAYLPRTANLLIILPAGYPNANLDMFWTFPDVKLVNGGVPQNCDHHQTYDGISWQRWSRHFNSAWRQGVDNIRTFIASVKHELKKGI
jgi:hypothetical protein